jgi:hypothetical protein
LKGHLIYTAHDESYEYVETLKENLSKPESVVLSSKRKDTKIVNIKLEGRRDNYLQVVIRYRSFFEGFKGKKNFIVTFYGSDKPKEGKKIWPLKSKK